MAFGGARVRAVRRPLLRRRRLLAERGRHEFDQRLADQARLARTRDARDRREHAEREIDREVVQIVARHARELEPALRRARRAGRRRAVAEKIGPRPRTLHASQALGRAAVEDFAAVLTGGRSHVHDPVGVADHVEFVFDDEERIARRLQPVERAQERLGVGGVQPGGGFVEHVDDAEEIGAHLRRQTEPLQFARRERGGAAFQGQIAQPEVEQDGDCAPSDPRRCAG